MEENEQVQEDRMSGSMPEAGHAHAPHGHGSGIRWLDVIVTICVVFISVVSLVVSIEHGRTMEKMVDQNQQMVVANTLPLLSMYRSQIGTRGTPQIRLHLHNEGVGPAIIDRFEMRYKGVSYTSIETLLEACCAEAYRKTLHDTHTKIIYSNVSGFILPARDEILPISIEQEKSNHALFDAFEKTRDDITNYACYCSVLNECWETNFDHKRPKSIKECRVDPNEKLW
jgi:hypothetical protein